MTPKYSKFHFWWFYPTYFRLSKLNTLIRICTEKRGFLNHETAQKSDFEKAYFLNSSSARMACPSPLMWGCFRIFEDKFPPHIDKDLDKEIPPESEEPWKGSKEKLSNEDKTTGTVCKHILFDSKRKSQKAKIVINNYPTNVIPTVVSLRIIKRIIQFFRSLFDIFLISFSWLDLDFCVIKSFNLSSCS